MLYEVITGYVLANLMLQKASGMTYFSLLEKTNEDLGINFIIGWPQNYSDKQPSGHLIPAQAGCVITSYSIHYTKLYEPIMKFTPRSLLVFSNKRAYVIPLAFCNIRFART